jgi:outer membrane protein OmpA-like peptidoglycan-associated protein
VLFDGDSPIPYDGFSIVREHAYTDKSGDQVDYFGIVKDLIDPQIEADKRWSQTLNLYLKQSQGGYFVEKGAIEDATQWKDTINAPGEDTLVSDGAISGAKIKEKKIAELPTASLQLNEFAQDLLKKISGVNPDLLGMDRGRQEPGVVIRMRQQQGLILLNNIFDNHHRTIKKMAERVFAIIMAYMPNAQIRRILGDSKNYIFKGDLVADVKNKVVAPLRNIKDLKYNVDVRESPANMTKTMAQLAIFMDMMSKGFPVDPEVIIEKLDITQAEKTKWIEYVKQTQQSQTQSQQAQLQLKAQADQGKLQIAEKKLELDAQKGQAGTGMEMEKLRQKELEDRRNFDMELAKLDQEGQRMVMGLVERLSQAPMQLPQQVGV